MKTSLFLVLGLALSIVSPSLQADEISNLVMSEMRALFDSAKADLARTQKKQNDLKEAHDKAVADSLSLAKLDEAGIELMKNYSFLLTSRYVNENGEFQKGLELTQKDKEFVNRIFEKHLHSRPLDRRVSAGEGQRLLTWGMLRLQELAKIHAEPTEATNSDLEIAAYQSRSNELLLKRLTERAQELASKVGGKLGTETAKDDTADKNRAPASQN